MSVRLSGPPAGSPGARIDLPRLARRTRAALRALGRSRMELSLALVSDREIAELNRTWRGLPRATDVLSFSLLEGSHCERRGRLLGDVVIGVETAARQARDRHRSLDEVLTRLMIHGLLHLVGHDHEADDDARVMAGEERRLWREIH